MPRRGLATRRTLAAACLAVTAVAACGGPAAPLAPPTGVQVTPGGPSAPGALLVEWTRSADDGAGRELAHVYVVVRGAACDDAMLPVAGTTPPRPDGLDARRVQLLDPGAPASDPAGDPAGSHVVYAVWAFAEADTPSALRPGAPAARSACSVPVRVPAATARPPAAPARAPTPRVAPPPNDDGTHLQLTWDPLPPADVEATALLRVLRARAPDGPFVPLPGAELPPTETTYTDTLADLDTVYFYRLAALARAGASVASPVSDAARPAADLFHEGKLAILVVIVAMLALSLGFLSLAQRGAANIFIRRIAGVDAIEEAVGRATEMGRPVLYVPGIDEIQNVQTIASLLILGRVAETVARYDSRILVPCCIPLVSIVAEDVVRQGFLKAGRPHAHRPRDVQWISSEQFAFCAGTNGLILREKPAANILLGSFFGESLVLAETGFVNGSIQIAGTAEITQLPFFIAACDYTLIGEELFATSAYLTREPKLLATLKAADWVKLAVMAVLLVGALGLVLAPDAAPVRAFADFFAGS